MVIQKTCKVCGKTESIKLNIEQYQMWKSGALLQDVTPELSADQRELLISGVCGTCFDTMFAEEDEDGNQ